MTKINPNTFVSAFSKSAPRKNNRTPVRIAFWLAVVFTLLCSLPFSPAIAQTPAKPAEQQSAGQTSNLGNACLTCRWLDMKSISFNTRYLFINDSNGVERANQLQHRESIEGRLKFDREGSLALNFGLSNGSYFSGGWNNMGMGRAEGSSALYLKQLYLSLKPVKGVELQYGSLGITNGQSTGITGYADVGYLMGERVIVTRPQNLFFDEVAVTYAYVGDYFAPNINKRYHRLRQSNFHQFLVGKKIGDRAQLSLDYTFHAGAETLRQAVHVKAPELRIVDSIRFENYQRVDVKPAYGFALTAEKQLTRRLSLGGGVAHVDKNFGPFNSDAFFDGRRFLVTGKYDLRQDFSISLLYNRAFANDYVVGYKNLLGIGFHYDLLKSLKQAGIF